jgi:lysophospholipase L1-like esterase
MKYKKYKCRYITAVFSFLLLIAGGCQQHDTKPAGTKPVTPPKTIKILTFGDSITRGVREGVRTTQTYTFYLEKILKEHNFQVHMIREGISGEDTRGALLRIHHDVIEKKPDYVTIMYGTNDAYIDVQDDKNDTTPRVPLKHYEKNVRIIIQKLKHNHIKPVLMTPIPLGNFRTADIGIYRHRDRNFLLKQYVETARRVAVEENVPLVDLFHRWLERKEKGQDIGAWLTDGMHPNPKGNRFIAAAIFNVLKNELIKN